MPFFPCNPTLYCANVGSPYGLPSDIGYTLNLPVLIEAGTRGLQQFSVASYVGISDAAAANNYQLKDGTPVPSSDLLPLWCPGWPTDGANGLTYMLVAYTSGAAPPIGFKDASCLFAFRAVCQIQL
uniref:Uncharacterized protein n=1 Tax=Plectus sambesii TaxID=2011161 RepID=A0A914W0M3_9BILA